MRSISILMFLAILGLCCSCQPQALPLPRLQSSPCSQIDNHSEIQFTRDASGVCHIEQGNRIANTHWLLVADRHLTLAQLWPLWRQLALKKKKGLHDDGRTDMYMVGYDTLHRRASLWSMKAFEWGQCPAAAQVINAPAAEVGKGSQPILLRLPAQWTYEKWLQWWSVHSERFGHRPIYVQILPISC